jgi:hypothetical protein
MSLSSLSDAEIAWCAGVVDALGLIRTRPMQTGSELCYVAVSSSKLDVLNALAELTGTKVTMVHREYSRVGCDEHCTEAHQHVNSTTGRWSLTGARALVFLLAIEPHLRGKAEDARSAIAAGETAPVKEATVRKMYELGWPALENA